MRVFLDTNVLASAVATRGLCADVLREVLSSHELLISAKVLSELRRVLKTKFAVAPDLIDDITALLRQDTLIAEPEELLQLAIKDQADLVILSAALAANAEAFVTGDNELLELGQVRNLSIISPRQFWDCLKARPRRGTARRKRRPSR